jgi:hypothetical protein
MVIRSTVRMVITILFAAFFLWVAFPSLYYFLNDDLFHIPLAAEKNFAHGTLLRPVSDLSLWLDHRIWGKNAFGYHLTNLLIHLINSLLVYLLAKELFSRYRGGEGEGELKAWLAALLFLVFAYHSEPVLWIIGRGGSLSTLFFLAACSCYLKRGLSGRYFFFALAFFCIGLFVYESIWVFPLVAFFISAADLRWGGRKGWNRELNYLIGILVLFGLFLLLRWAKTGSLMGSYEMRMSSRGNIVRLLYNYSALFARNFLPPMANGKLFLFFTCLLLILLASASFFIAKRRKAGGLFGLLGACLLVSLLPAITLGIDTHDTESERFIYLPSMFTVLLLTELIFLLIRRTDVATWVLLALCLLNGLQFREAALSYRYAGTIARRSLSFMDEKKPLENVYLFRMPSQYKGALIFRAGIQPALTWMDPGLSYRNLVVISQGEPLQRRDAFSCVERDLRSSADMLGARIGVDTIGAEWLIQLPDTVLRFQPGRDRIFYWTDSSLVKISKVGGGAWEGR